MPRNNRRNFLFKTGALATLFGLPGLLFSRDRRVKTMDMAPFAHIVFFWLKEPDNPQAQKAFKEHAHAYLSKIDFIQGIHFGQPAGTPREVVDNSYTYNMILFFKNQEDQDRYQDHKDHLKFVEDAAHLWDRVQVYDSLKA